MFDILDNVWGYLQANYSPFELHTWVEMVVHLSVFWPFCLAYMMVDLFEWPKFLAKYKIQQDKGVTWNTYKFVFKVALINQFLVAYPFSLVITGFRILLGQNTCPTELPAIGTVIRDLVAFVFIEEIGFFYSHYFFHRNKTLYKTVHKFHHRMTSPVAAACIFAHPLEHVVANILPLILGPIIMGSHIVTEWLWLTIAIINTIHGHSGYEFPNPMPRTSTHDWHHEGFNDNFGSIGLLDWIHGTAGKRTDKKEHKHTSVTDNSNQADE